MKHRKEIAQYLNGRKVREYFAKLKTKTGKPAAKATQEKALKAFQTEKWKAYEAALAR